MDPQILLQGFYRRGKYVAVAAPSDPHDPHDSPWWWDHLAESAMDLAQVGITSVWLPPATKAAQGSQEAALGYSVFDDYDIGSKEIDAQAYRLDHVQGISVLYLQALLNGDIAAGKFAVGEYWDGDRDKINDWITSNDWMRNRCSAFDFPLYFKLLAMSNDANFDMSTLDHAGLAGVNSFRAVTFVENQDTESRRDLVPRNIQPEDKPLAYAYILTSEGLPCVFFKDYSTAPGCLGDILRPALVNLMWIHQNIAAGPTEQRWKSQDVFMFERTGGPGLLVGLNRSKTQAQHLTGIVTNFRPDTTLHDYAGHAPDITTDGRGRVDVTVPSGNNGQGYVCYSVPSIGSRPAPAPQDAHQVFEGAADLDIPCAAAGKISDIARICCERDTAIEGVLSFHSGGWTPDTTLMLSLYGPAGAAVASRPFRQADTGAVLAATATEKGFYRWTIQANDSRADFTCPFSVAVRYRAPTTL